MPDYELTPDAEIDLVDIALYTLKTWGIEQADRYEAALETNLNGIGSGETRTGAVFEHRSDLRFSRCEHHYVFAQIREDGVPLIVAVFHERMDLMVRLRERLDRGEWPPGVKTKDILLTPATELSLQEFWDEREFLLNLLSALSARIRLQIGEGRLSKDTLLQEVTGICGVLSNRDGGFSIGRHRACPSPRSAPAHRSPTCLSSSRWRAG